MSVPILWSNYTACVCQVYRHKINVQLLFYAIPAFFAVGTVSHLSLPNRYYC